MLLFGRQLRNFFHKNFGNHASELSAGARTVPSMRAAVAITLARCGSSKLSPISYLGDSINTLFVAGLWVVLASLSLDSSEVRNIV